MNAKLRTALEASFVFGTIALSAVCTDFVALALLTVVVIAVMVFS